MCAACGDLAEDTVKSLISSDALIGNSIELYSTAASTNDICLNLCRNQMPEGAVVIADAQTEGRGRLGRKWISPPEQNIYMSILLRPDMHPKSASVITLLASIACIKAIKLILPNLEAHIKWPNDIMIGHKKAGGILTESRIEGTKVSCTIVGIGLNVNMPEQLLPRETIIPATSILAETETALNRSELAAAIIKETEECYLLLKNKGSKAVIDIWLSMSKMIGSQITVTSNEDIISGIAEGLDEDGMLIVRDQIGLLKTIISGDVRIVSHG
ncbi:MAG: biotin--[acetyl-CoA-carboxylase] ligase [Nitrospirae bacterium]|nr:biotin--[acetyl-CoA-carboxylase] ligase [Nitrospirota bacterium]